jgi:hypothetical protein
MLINNDLGTLLEQTISKAAAAAEREKQHLDKDTDKTHGSIARPINYSKRRQHMEDRNPGFLDTDLCLFRYSKTLGH